MDKLWVFWDVPRDENVDEHRVGRCEVGRRENIQEDFDDHQTADSASFVIQVGIFEGEVQRIKEGLRIKPQEEAEVRVSGLDSSFLV